VAAACVITEPYLAAVGPRRPIATRYSRIHFHMTLRK